MSDPPGMPPSRPALRRALNSRGMKLSDDDFKKYVISALNRLTDDMATVKSDVAGLKTDVAGLKTEVSSIKSDVANLATQLMGLERRVANLERESFLQYGRLTRDVREFRERFEAHEALSTMQLNAFDARFHDVTVGLADLRTLHTSSTQVILAKLDDHERRISALERGGGP
jgi:chromosome segregation ATPase